MNKWRVVLHQFSGKHLPERQVPLGFTPPKRSKGLKAGNPGSRDLRFALDDSRDRPSEYFALLLAEIKDINRCSLSVRRRFSLTRGALKLFYPMALVRLAKYAKTGGIPEDEDRRKTLGLLLELTQILMVSCQILFSHYYTASNFRYARARHKVYESASRIFELLLLKQQARGLSYQLLSDHDWKVANTIFYIMSSYEEVDRPLLTLRKKLGLEGPHGGCSLRELLVYTLSFYKEFETPLLTLKNRLGLHDLHNGVSLAEQFILLHMVARYDVLRWPTHLQRVIASYMSDVGNAVQVRRCKEGEKPGRDDLIAQGSLPAGACPSGSPAGPALMLACQGLNEAIRKDSIALVRAKREGSAVPPRFARFPETEHFVIHEQLLRGLWGAVDEPGAERPVPVDDLRVFAGFSSVFDLLRHQQGMYASEKRLDDLLSSRSSWIAPDHLGAEKNAWTLLFQNEKLIRLCIAETTLGTPIAMGSLLAYGVGEDINRPSLAIVSRIFRPAGKGVVIDLSLISHYIEAVVLTVNASERSERNLGKRALLIYNRQGEWELMIAPQSILPGFDQLEMRRNMQVFPIKLGARRHASADFCLFSTSLTSNALGWTNEPAYSVPAVRKTHLAGWLL
jgi:hypothetical protein